MDDNGAGGMRVPYEIRASSHGNGVFAAADIAEGELIWSFAAAQKSLYTESEAKAFITASPRVLTQLLEYGYWSSVGTPLLVDISRDDGRFFNHSESPNVYLGSVAAQRRRSKGFPASLDPHSTYAAADIAAGEELLDDYNTYGKEPRWYSELLAANGVDTSYMHSSAAAEEDESSEDNLQIHKY